LAVSPSRPGISYSWIIIQPVGARTARSEDLPLPFFFSRRISRRIIPFYPTSSPILNEFCPACLPEHPQEAEEVMYFSTFTSGWLGLFCAAIDVPAAVRSTAPPFTWSSLRGQGSLFVGLFMTILFVGLFMTNLKTGQRISTNSWD